MSKNIITIDIDSDRNDSIKITKPEEFYKKYKNHSELLTKDIEDITLTSLYLSSMLSSEDELIMLNKIKNKIKYRIDEITREG